MKNKRGVTLIALMVTIIVMAIIVGIIVTESSDVLQKSKITDYIGYMKLVKTRADVVFEDELFKTSSISTGDEISMIEDIKKIDGEEENTLFDNKIQDYNVSGKKFIKWGGKQIAAQGIDKSILNPGEDGVHANDYDEYDDYEEYFVIIYDESNFQTVDVIYSAGCGLDGNRYYTLTDMEDVIF